MASKAVHVPTLHGAWCARRADTRHDRGFTHGAVAWNSSNTGIASQSENGDQLRAPSSLDALVLWIMVPENPWLPHYCLEPRQ